MADNKFIQELLDQGKESQLISSFHAILDDEAMKHIEIYEILGIDKKRINESGQKIVNLLEHENVTSQLYATLKWKILALITVQDAFQGALKTVGGVNSMFYKNYFYFEGLHILREYFYCGFNNFQIAAQHLLRTIMEFNIKQNYFDYISATQNSFESLENYINDGIAPRPVSMLNTFLPKDGLAKPLKKQVQTLLKGLSGSSSHAYMPMHSVRASGKLQHEYSIESMFFWVVLLPVLDSILWMYYFQLPQLFNPKDTTKKFGFSPPVGCFISPEQHVAIKKSLTPKDYKIFRKLAVESDEIKSLNHFYDSQPDMTDEQIMKTWDKSRNNHEPESIKAGYFITVVQLRAMQEVLANHCAVESAKKYSAKKDFDKLFADISKYEWWLKYYKQVH